MVGFEGDSLELKEGDNYGSVPGPIKVENLHVGPSATFLGVIMWQKTAPTAHGKCQSGFGGVSPQLTTAPDRRGKEDIGANKFGNLWSVSKGTPRVKEGDNYGSVPGPIKVETYILDHWLYFLGVIMWQKMAATAHGKWQRGFGGVSPQLTTVPDGRGMDYIGVNKFGALWFLIIAHFLPVHH